ncbi:MAG: helix-turn-helix domain-containing protein, partial [Patescibacteria group bacterium]
MSKTIKQERLRWVLPIFQREIKLTDVAKICPYSKRSLERWLAVYRQAGLDALEPKSTEPKTQPKETPIRIKERVIEVRQGTKKCALKIHWQLAKEGI